MRLDENIEEIKGGRKCPHIKWCAPVIPDDLYRIVSDLLLLEQAPMNVWHHSADMEGDSGDIVPPRHDVLDRR